MKRFSILISAIVAFASFTFNPPGCNACTIFVASNGKSTLVGNNEDFRPGINSYLWINPSENNKYGYIFWGFDKKYPEGGMNELGLFFDAAALPQKIPVIKDPTKPDFEGYLVEKVLSSCATVEEAVQLFKSFNLTWQEKAQIMVADKSGDYAIIHANYVIRKNDPTFVLTNYSLQDPNTEATNCWRRKTAYDILNSKPLSTATIKNALEETAQKASDNSTVYSQICDLKNGVIYLYQNHNYSQKKEIRLKDILSSIKQEIVVKSLFPASIKDELKTYLQDHTMDQTIAHYKQLRQNELTAYNFSEQELDYLAYELIDSTRIVDAIKILKLNLEYHPTSDMAYASLANAYLVGNDYTKADQLYSKVRQINPQNIYLGLFDKQKNEITFRIRGMKGAKKIVLVSSFNNNDTQSAIFRKHDSDWIYTAKLPKGEYTYKLYVDDLYWMEDPGNKLHKNQGEWWDSLLIVR